MLPPAAEKAVPEKAGWITTTLKPADLKDNEEFTAVDGHQIVVTRLRQNMVMAMTNVCTHKQCVVKPTAGSKTLVCQCHKSEFNLDASVAHAPATKPLGIYAIRVSDKGVIEIDPGTTPTKDAKEYSVTIA